jgi:acetyl esterase/lipase
LLHLIAGALLLAISLLAVLPPPAPVFWLLSVPVREWGYLLALLCLPLLWPGWIGSPLTAIGSVCAMVAAVLFLVPLAQGAGAARKLGAPFSWMALLTTARARRAAVQTLTFAVHDGVALKMDVTRPAVTPAPAVIVIHGGAWRGGDRRQLPALNHYLTARGYVTAAISYRLAPKYRFPDAMADVTAAIAYVKEHAAELGVDPGRLVLLGRSAGAHLAAVAAYTLDDPAIRGAVSYYGPFDLAWGYDQPCKVLDSKTVLGDFLGGDPRTVPEAYRAASPLHLVHPRTPPLLMIQGGADTMVSPRHCDHLIEKLEAAERPYRLVLVPGATHGSDFHFSGPFGQISTWAVAEFLREVL